MDIKSEIEIKDEIIENPRDRNDSQEFELETELEEIQENNFEFEKEVKKEIKEDLEIKDEPFDIKEEYAEDGQPIEQIFALDGIKSLIGVADLGERCSKVKSSENRPSTSVTVDQAIEENCQEYLSGRFDNSTFKNKVMDSSTFYGNDTCYLIPSESECSGESSDEEPEPRVFVLNGLESEAINDEEEGEWSDVPMQMQQWQDEVQSQETQETCQSSNENEPRKKKSSIYWKKDVTVNPNLYQWKGTPKGPSPVDTPFSYFHYYFDDALLESIVEEANLFAVQQNPNKSLNLTVNEFQQFLGVAIYMSCSPLPNSRFYWNKKYRCAYVADVMTRDRWEEIKFYLHFNDNNKQLPRDHENYDRLFKIRPFIDSLHQKVTQRVPTNEYLSIDEQMVPYKRHHVILQYKPNKPKKWGFKVFLLTDDTGIIYNFYIYVGKIQKVDGFPDISASGNIMLSLCSVIPRNQNYKVFFDNWFSRIPMFVELAKIGIQALGTARSNRIPNSNFPTDKRMKRDGRGSVVSFSADLDGTKIRSVKYFDNRSVLFLTTYALVEPMVEKIKCDRSKKKDVPVKVLEIVRAYNSHMDRIDKLDQLIALYRNKVKCRKWYSKIFFHFLDMFCVSAWLEYKRDSQVNNVNKRDIKGLLDFKIEIAEHLCKGGKTIERKRKKRPSAESVERDHEEKKRKGPVKPIPCTSVRKDDIGHYPRIEEAQGRCKLPSCNGKSKFTCSKCEVHLCLTKERNCFTKFHTE